jgi:RHS repeat-associated protein
VSNGTTANYKYDGLGRRVEKEIVSASTTVTRYVYDNEDILLELDGTNNIVARYTHGPGIDEPLIMEKGGANLYYHADALGSITEITNNAGSPVQRYGYSSFGKIESQLDSNVVQPYAFTAREADVETRMYFYRHRGYESFTGRFNEQDPLGFLGGLNFYTYVWNNPTNYTDPFGESVFCGSGPTSVFIPDSWYGKYSFAAACINHDDCYGECGKVKMACDRAFYTDLLKECSKLTGYWHSDCVVTARTYYYAVSRFGGGPYKAAQLELDCSCQR